MKRIGYIDGRRIAGFTLRGTAALNGINIPVTDVIEVASGITRGIYLNYTMSGAKTGSAIVEGIAIDLAISANVPTVNGIDLYRAAIDNHTISRLTCLEIYSENRGNAVTSQYDIMIARNSNAVLTGPGNDAFLYMREHSTVQDGSHVMLLMGLNAAEYFLGFGSAASSGKLLLENSAAGDSTVMRIRCDTIEGVRWLHLHDQ